MNSIEKVIISMRTDIEDYIKARTGSSYVSGEGSSASLYNTFVSYLPSLPLSTPAFSATHSKVDNAKKLVVALQELQVRAATAHKTEDIKNILEELLQAINEQVAREKELFGVFVGPGEYDKKLDYIISIVCSLMVDSELKLLSAVSFCENIREKLIIDGDVEFKYLPTEVVSYLYSKHFASIKKSPDTSTELISMELFNLTNFFCRIQYTNQLMMLNSLNASLNNLEKDDNLCEDNQIKQYNKTVKELLIGKKSYLQAASKLQ